MTATDGQPYVSAADPSRGGFGHLLLAEFTKVRTVRGWVAALLVGALLIVGIGLLSAGGNRRECQTPNGPATGKACAGQAPPTAPGGVAVTDNFSFVHRQLDGDGSITARVVSLNMQVPSTQNGPGAGNGPSWQAGVVPWAKAGLIVKQNTNQGSAYAAIMTTGAHGVRMQYDYTHDVAGSDATASKTAPRWLRLTRSGDTLTGYESTNATTWTKVGAVKLGGLRATVQIGLFVASPDYDVTTEEIVGTSTSGGPSKSTATFDHVSLQNNRPAGGWQATTVGGGGADDGPAGPAAHQFSQSDGVFSVTGSGDIAPTASGGGDNNTVGGALIGSFVGLMALVVLGALFVTAEYRRGLIRTTLAASPRRGRVLAAKAIVLGGLCFVFGLAAAAFTMWLVDRLRRSNGAYIAPASIFTELRVVIGTAALLAVSSVFALAVGTILRRSATAVAAVLALVVLPYILAVSSIGALQWLLRVTPAAGFAVQETLHRYPQVDGVYIASAGYYPLGPWAGFGVLCAWTAVALGLAVFLLRKRDA